MSHTMFADHENTWQILISSLWSNVHRDTMCERPCVCVLFCVCVCTWMRLCLLVHLHVLCSSTRMHVLCVFVYVFTTTIVLSLHSTLCCFRLTFPEYDGVNTRLIICLTGNEEGFSQCLMYIINIWRSCLLVPCRNLTGDNCRNDKEIQLTVQREMTCIGTLKFKIWLSCSLRKKVKNLKVTCQESKIKP